MGTTSTKNRFIVSGCSPTVQASNSEINPVPFTVVILNEMFTGNRIELGPIPDRIEIQSNSLFERTFTIFIKGGGTFLNFTIHFDLFLGGSILLPGNTPGFLDIESNKAFSIGISTPNTICGKSSSDLLEVPFVIRAIVLKTIPNFVMKGDVYTITIFISRGPTNLPLYGVFAFVEITRSKSPILNF